MSSTTTAGGEQWPPPAFDRGKFTTGSCLMLAAILSLMVILVLISFHLYTRYRREYIPSVQFYQSFPSPRPTPLIQGLSAASIAALPIFVYRRKQSGGAEDCAVCLSSPEDGDPVRVLPDCKHVFHVGCIDAWLQSHSTCPVCRAEARPGVVRFEFGDMLAAPRLPERVSGAGEVELLPEGGGKEGSSELRDLERQ